MKNNQNPASLGVAYAAAAVLLHFNMVAQDADRFYGGARGYAARDYLIETNDKFNRLRKGTVETGWNDPAFFL